MLLGLGATEIVLGLPVLIAAIMGNCTPTTIAASSWVTFHGLIGLLLGCSFLFLYGPTVQHKRIVRIIFFATIGFGIGLGIAAAIHGGVGNKLGTYTDQLGLRRWYYQYDYDLFFGVFLAVCETGLLLVGVWSIFADREKAEKLRLLASSRNSSFASLAAFQQTIQPDQLDDHPRKLFQKSKASKDNLAVPLPEADNTAVALNNTAVAPTSKAVGPNNIAASKITVTISNDSASPKKISAATPVGAVASANNAVAPKNSVVIVDETALRKTAAVAPDETSKLKSRVAPDTDITARSAEITYPNNAVPAKNTVVTVNETATRKTSAPAPDETSESKTRVAPNTDIVLKSSADPLKEVAVPKNRPVPEDVTPPKVVVSAAPSSSSAERTESAETQQNSAADADDATVEKTNLVVPSRS